MSPNDRYRLRHMAEAAEAALQFVQGRRREDLDHDRQLVMALTRAVEIVGEAATQVSAAGRTELPDIPWRRSPACVTAWCTPISTSTWTFCGIP